jgi:hypothetical protein
MEIAKRKVEERHSDAMLTNWNEEIEAVGKIVDGT